MRRNFEKEIFNKLTNDENEYDYLIDRNWYKKWYEYVRYRAEMSPGEMDNKNVLKQN
jgi:hypothetical protein